MDTIHEKSAIIPLGQFYRFVFEGIKTSQHATEDQMALQKNRKVLPYFPFMFTSRAVDKELARNFRSVLRQLHAESMEDVLFGHHEDPLPPPSGHYQFPDEESIQLKFAELNAHYGFFSGENLKVAQNRFMLLFRACKLFSDYIECHHDVDNQEAFLNAYKIMVITGFSKTDPFAVIQTLIQSRQGPKPLHDLLIRDLPLNQPPLQDINGWRLFIQKFGFKGLEVFQMASGIEAITGGKSPRDLDQANKIISKITYARYEENPELAILCKRYKRQEAHFERCLEIEQRRKLQDRLPDIQLDGEQGGYPGYHIVKLPIHDLRVYVIGEITHCCQSIGENSEACVIDAVTLETSGVYVLLKKKTKTPGDPMIDGSINDKDFDIVGQGYAWLSKDNNFVLDSWENLRPAVDDEVITALLPIFAKSLTEKNQETYRVTIGTGGKTPEALQKVLVKNPEEMTEGVQYGDSVRQALIYLDKERFMEKFKPRYEQWKMKAAPEGKPLTAKAQHSQRDAWFMNAPNAGYSTVFDYESCFQILSLLESKGIASPENIQLLLENAFQKDREPADFLIVLQILDEAGQLSDETFKLTGSGPSDEFHYFKFLSDGLILLHNENLLNPENIRLFFKLSTLDSSNFAPTAVGEILVDLQKSGLLSMDNLADDLITLYRQKNAGWTSLASDLGVLFSSGMLTGETLKLLAEAKANITFAPMLFKIAKDLGLSADNTKALLKDPGLDSLLPVFSVLCRVGELTRENYSFFMEPPMRKGLLALLKADLFSKENFDALVKDPENAEFRAAKLCIEKALKDYHLMNGDNAVLLEKNAQYVLKINALIQGISSPQFPYPGLAKTIIQAMLFNPANIGLIESAITMDSEMLTEETLTRLLKAAADNSIVIRDYPQNRLTSPDKIACCIDALLLNAKIPGTEEKYRAFLLEHPEYTQTMEKAFSILGKDFASLNICFHILEKADLIATGLQGLKPCLSEEQYQFLIASPQAAELALQFGKVIHGIPVEKSPHLIFSTFKAKPCPHERDLRNTLIDNIEKQIESLGGKGDAFLQLHAKNSPDTEQYLVLEMLKAYVNKQISLLALKTVLQLNPNNSKSWNSGTVDLVNEVLQLSNTSEKQPLPPPK